MQHLAILRKSWNLDKKILSGTKSIESRWYKQRRAPWNKIQKGETVFFKNSGEPVTLKAEVAKVIQIEDLTPQKVEELLNGHYTDLGIKKESIPKFTQQFKDKRYCILIHLKNPKTIEPFNIDKTGYGLMAAWITVDDINTLKK